MLGFLAGLLVLGLVGAAVGSTPLQGGGTVASKQVGAGFTSASGLVQKLVDPSVPAIGASTSSAPTTKAEKAPRAKAAPASSPQTPLTPTTAIPYLVAPQAP